MRYIWLQFKRKPLIAVAVILFSAIIALTLCGLHKGAEEVQSHFEEIYHAIEVRCTVTNLSGTQSDGLTIGPRAIFRLTGKTSPDPRDAENVADLVKDVQIKGSCRFAWNGVEYTLSGITSLQIAPALWLENGCTVFYNEGADESFFGGEGLQCIIPEAMMKTIREKELPENVLTVHLDAGNRFEMPFDGQLQIVGTYHSQDGKTIYCPWETYRQIIRSMNGIETADAMFATLASNDDVVLLRESTAGWFAEPDPNNAGKLTVNDLYLGLDINDSRLRQAEETLENSLMINRAAAILIFALSAGAGAVVGFLIIRSRKRDIVLMRTMGTSNGRIGVSFALEQLVCVALGIVLGGSYTMWQPMGQLTLFVGIYFIGLTVAMLVFLRKNLLATIEEEE